MSDSTKNAPASPNPDDVFLHVAWRDTSIDIRWAAIKWLITIIGTAIAAHGGFDTASPQTWLGALVAAAASWSHLSKLHSSNLSTKDLWLGAIDLIDALQTRKKGSS